MTQASSITIDPTFWTALFSFLTILVTSVFTYKTKRNTEEIAKKVDGAATATQTEIGALRTEIQRLQEDRLARADKAPGIEQLATSEVVPVIVMDAAKPLPVDIVKKD